MALAVGVSRLVIRPDRIWIRLQNVTILQVNSLTRVLHACVCTCMHMCVMHASRAAAAHTLCCPCLPFEAARLLQKLATAPAAQPSLLFTPTTHRGLRPRILS